MAAHQCQILLIGKRPPCREVFFVYAFAGMPRQTKARFWIAHGPVFLPDTKPLEFKLEFIDHCQRLLLEEKLSPKVTDEV